MSAAASLGSHARTRAEAKINLSLRVLAREASGFHQLETLFQRVRLADDVAVRVGGHGDSIDCRGADVGPPERNLAWRAAHAYRARTGWPAAFAIEVDKRIPVGGGLGGGSADAGAVLRCLDALAPRPLGAMGVVALAGSLGSDVPFLAGEHALALAWGRGERMLSLAPLPTRAVVLCLFDRGVATPEAFAWLAAERGDPAPEPRAWTLDDFATWDDVSAFARNDFEPPVFARRPDVREVYEALSTAVGRAPLGAPPREHAAVGFPPIVRMTGSGATVAVLPPAGVPVFYSPRPGQRLVTTRTAERAAAVEILG